MKKLRYTQTALAVGTLATLVGGDTSQAQSVDALLDKLVDKGYLTLSEANELRDETDKDFTRAYAARSGMPEWVTALKLNGDFRARYEGFYFDSTGPGHIDRHRWRYRLRFGVVANMWDNFEAGLRLGSGDLDSASTLNQGTDPISSNQTFQNNGSKKGIFLDLAYGKWTPINLPEVIGTFTVGKMENPFVYSDMVFDKDYTPEGAAMQWTYNVSDLQQIKFNGGAFALDELGTSTHDPYMFGAQARWDAIWNRTEGGAKEWSSTFGVGVLNLWHKESLGNAAVPNINTGNTRTTAGALVNNLNPVIADAGLTYKVPSMYRYNGPFPITLAGEIMHNPAASRRNTGWNFGLTFGKSGKRTTWDIGYRYKYLEADAWYEEVTDSDFGAFYQSAPAGGGSGSRNGTNIKGHVIKANWTPYDALTLTVTYFLTDLVDANPKNSKSQTHRLQVDAVWKF